MKKFKNFTLKEYVEVLSKKEPTPGGGSAAAYAGALGVGLILMVAHYSQGKSEKKSIENQLNTLIKKSETYRNRLLELVDLDAEAYMRVVKARKGMQKEKDTAAKAATKIPKEVCKVCYQAVQLLPFLVENGNKHLIGDVEVAAELLLSAFNSAQVLQ